MFQTKALFVLAHARSDDIGYVVWPNRSLHFPNFVSELAKLLSLMSFGLKFVPINAGLCGNFRLQRKNCPLAKLCYAL